jgi:hypothetical protein
MLQNNQENNPKIFSDISVLDADVMCYDDDDRNVVIVFSLVFFSADLPVSLFFVLLPFESFLSLSHTPSNFSSTSICLPGRTPSRSPFFFNHIKNEQQWRWRRRPFIGRKSEKGAQTVPTTSAKASAAASGMDVGWSALALMPQLICACSNSNFNLIKHYLVAFCECILK